MNEELLRLSDAISTLEDDGNIISVILMDLSREFKQLEKVSLEELINKIDEIYSL